MEDREFSYINVIPLVDIMLVLLTIVLTTATFIVQGEVPVSLPSAGSSQERRTYQALSITVTKEGRILFAGKEVGLEELSKALGSYDRKTPVNIRTDRDARVQSFVSVMDILSKLGFKSVNLLVRKHGD